MFRIGEFSRIARVSMRLLRHYEELGLLRPAHTDAGNGYRYYTAAQLAELNRILVLRGLGLSLEQIARCLQDSISSGELKGMLLMRRAEIEQSQAELALQLRMLESRVASLDTDPAEPLDDVVIRSEPERLFVSLRSRERSFSAALALALELQRELPLQLGRAGLGPFIVVSHAPEFEPDDLDLELGFAVESAPARAPVLNGQRLQCGRLPGYERVASCVRFGSPAQAHLTTARIGSYLERTGYQLAGPNRELFLQLPRDGDVDTAVVEMAFPIEDSSAAPGRV
jgi:DNA-binding transcriptional MerR regulator